MRQPTVREIAEACGCSRQAVSLALRGMGGVSAERRKAILAKAEAMGWRPNPLANAYMAQLRQRQRGRITANLACLSFSQYGPGMKDLPPYLQSVIESAMQRAEELGYAMDLIWVHGEGINARSLQRILNYRNIRGVYLSSEYQAAPWIADLTWTRQAVCASGLRRTSIPVDTINHDRSKALEIAFRRVIDLGYRRIGFSCDEGILKLGAAQDLLRYQWLGRTEFPACTAEPHVFAETETAQTEALATWIRTHDLEIIIGTGRAVEQFEALPETLRERTGFVDLDARSSSARYAGINQRHETTGKLMAEWLAKQVETNVTGLPQHPLRLLYTAEWVDGEALPPPRYVPSSREHPA